MTATTTDPLRRQRTAYVLGDIVIERRLQTAKHGDQTDLPDGTGPEIELLAGDVELAENLLLTFGALAVLQREQTNARSRSDGDGTITFADVLLEEVFEAVAESDPVALRRELVQVAAAAVQWVEALDERAAVAS